MSDAYDFVQHLAGLAPVFTAAPGTDREFVRPTGWSSLTLEGNTERIAAWRPGHALMALMGGAAAVLDVDTKNGADAERARQLLDGLNVRVYADVLTPSGGRHLYVAGHADLPTVHAQADRDGLTGHPGVEVISYGANVFLPGTIRPKYDGAGYVVLDANLEALVDGGDPDGAETFAAWVAENRTASAERFELAEPWTGTPPDRRQAAYLAATVRNVCDRIAAMRPESGRNTSVFNAGMCFGNYIAGAGMDEAEAVEQLYAAASRCGLVTEDGERSVRASIHSGLRNGKVRPRAVPEPPEPTWLADPVPPNVDPTTGEIDTDDATLAALEQAAAFAREVTLEAHRLRVRDKARETVAGEKAKAADLPPVESLTAFLQVPDEDVTHRVAGLWPSGGRVVFSAPHKAGKTTLSGNLLRSLVDGDPFLDSYDVMPVRRVVLLDNELDPRMLRRWLRDQGIVNTVAVDLIPLRGRLSTFDLLDPATRTRWAQHIGAADAVILDCLRPALDALALSEDKDAGRFLEALDELTTEAGIGETLVVHHMGHSGERSRGDSRILDWPDAVWKLVKDAEDEEESAAQARRYFTAYGRDVDQPEVLLSFDPATRHLSIGGGSRNDVRRDHIAADVLEYVAAAPGCTQSAIERAVEGRRDTIRAAVKALVEHGEIVRERAGQAFIHSAAPTAPDPAPAHGLGNPQNRAPAPLGRGAVRYADGDTSEATGRGAVPMVATPAITRGLPGRCSECGFDHDTQAPLADAWHNQHKQRSA